MRAPFALGLLLLAALAGCRDDHDDRLRPPVPFPPADAGRPLPDAARPTPDAARPRPDAARPPADAARPPADAGLTCQGWSAPTTAACCRGCQSPQAGGTCQANGCFGGWWCDPAACRCHPVPAGCETEDDDENGGGPPVPETRWPLRTGPLACAALGTWVAERQSGECGAWRWSIKTAADANARFISDTPQRTTIAELWRLVPPPDLGFGTSRGAGTERTVYRLDDVHLRETKLEGDSDYHLVIDDGARTMIIEVPFPGCVAAEAPFGCNISRARAAIDARTVVRDRFTEVDETVSVVGVGFYDEVHGQEGVAPNGIELHPVLGLCFGRGCDPTAQ